MHRVELKGSSTTASLLPSILFLMHRVELKDSVMSMVASNHQEKFLMHRVELKADCSSFSLSFSFCFRS